MENCMTTSLQLIADSYERYHFSVYLYIYNKVNNKEEAEDLSQDVFVRLMDYKQMLRPDTVKFFIYTISRNLVNDYLRRYYKPEFWISNFPSIEDNSRKTLLWRTSRSPLPYVYV